MKKNIFHITITVVVVCVAAIIAYRLMYDAGCFSRADNLPETGFGGTVLIPVMRYIWGKIVQLFYILVSVAIGILTLCSLGIIL
jgi:hypothetical protein